jgi:hypothetical protein
MNRVRQVAVAVCVVASAVIVAAQGGPPASSPELTQALALIQANKPAEALPILKQLTAKEPQNAAAWRALGSAAHLTKDYDAAIEAYTKSLALQPNNAVARYNLACAYARKGSVDAAFEWLQKAKATMAIDIAQIQTDADLVSLKDDPRFAALLPKPSDFENPFVEPTKVLIEWRGEAANDQFGWIARNIGDVDGDGVADVVTSAPTKAIGGTPAGRVYVYSTKTRAKLWSADGQGSDRLGIGVEGAGDVNRDGVPDVIAAAPGGGYAHVYSGRDGRVLLRLEAEDKANDTFGRHVSGAGDVNGDGHADVMVGAPGNSAGGKGAGRAYVFSGKDGAKLLTLTGEREGDAFGSAVAGESFAGRNTLLIVGAPTAGPNKRGRVYVYDGLTDKPRFVVDADETGAALGAMFLATPGDINNDGVRDVYSSDFPNAAKGPSTGRVYIHSGKDGRLLLTLTGSGPGEAFGTSPSNAGDVNGDGHADLIVGAWQYAGAATSGGRAYLYSGKDGALLKTFTCRTPGDTFGFDAVALGDVDGDRTVDFLITSAWSHVNGFRSGRVFVISSGVLPAHR